jgi:hypothetical protein
LLLVAELRKLFNFLVPFSPIGVGGAKLQSFNSSLPFRGRG